MLPADTHVPESLEQLFETGEAWERLSRTARSLGGDIEEAAAQRAGSEAGIDAGQWFFTVPLGGASLAIRQDCMTIYLSELSPKVRDRERLLELCSACGIGQPSIPGIGDIRSRLDGRPARWVPIAIGSPAVQADWTRYYYPGTPTEEVPSHTLGLVSQRLVRLFHSSELDPDELATTSGLLALPGDLLAAGQSEASSRNGRDVFDQMTDPQAALPSRPEPGEGVEQIGEEYRATSFGYVQLNENTLFLQLPFWTDPNWLRVCFCLLDDRPRPVERGVLEKWFAEHGVVDGIQWEEVDAAVEMARRGCTERKAAAVAVGIEPVPGEDAQLELMVDVARRAGIFAEDGSIDFRDVNFVPNVRAGQMVAGMTPAAAGTPGHNVKGSEVTAEYGQDAQILPGEAISARASGEVTMLYAEKDGLLRVSDTEILVTDVLTIDGDVDFSTGNLKFNGEILVNGSVNASFSVKAEGDITITGTVEAGSEVVSRRNVSVSRGIVGRKARVSAGGSVQSQFVQDATVICDRDLMLGNYSQHAALRSGGKIEISRGAGRLGGCLVGGESWGLRGIDAEIVGSPSHTRTVLSVGLDPKQAQKLDLLRQKIEEGNGHIVRQLDRFKLDHVDVAQIKKMLAASTGPRRSLLARSARQLGQALQINQRLMQKQSELEQSLEQGERQAEINVRSKVFPAVFLRLGRYEKEISCELPATRFYLKKDAIAGERARSATDDP